MTIITEKNEWSHQTRKIKWHNRCSLLK